MSYFKTKTSILPLYNGKTATKKKRKESNLYNSSEPITFLKEIRGYDMYSFLLQEDRREEEKEEKNNYHNTKPLKSFSISILHVLFFSYKKKNIPVERNTLLLLWKL